MASPYRVAHSAVRCWGVSVALVAAGCRAGTPASQAHHAAMSCLSRDAIVAAAGRTGKPTDNQIRQKLEAPLRQLHAELVGAVRRAGADAPLAPDAAADAGACIPERVGVTVSFTGLRADLEAAGLGIASVFADPERDVSFASGAIASLRIGDLALVSHVRFIYAVGEVVHARSSSPKAIDPW